MLAMLDRTDTLLMLTPHPGPVKAASLELIQALFAVTATGIQLQVRNASPAYLAESRAASSERARTVAEMTEVHAATPRDDAGDAALGGSRRHTCANLGQGDCGLGSESACVQPSTCTASWPRSRPPPLLRGCVGNCVRCSSIGKSRWSWWSHPSTGVGYPVKWRTAPARSSAARSWPCRISRRSRESGWPGPSTRLRSRSTSATTVVVKPTWLTWNANCVRG